MQVSRERAFQAERGATYRPCRSEEQPGGQRDWGRGRRRAEAREGTREQTPHRSHGFGPLDRQTQLGGLNVRVTDLDFNKMILTSVLLIYCKNYIHISKVLKN